MHFSELIVTKKKTKIIKNKNKNKTILIEFVNDIVNICKVDSSFFFSVRAQKQKNEILCNLLV